MSNDGKSNDEADFFAKDVPFTPPTAAKAPASSDATPELAPRASGWRAAIKPTLVLCAALVLAAVWIFGKPFLSGSPGQGMPPSSVDPAASRYFAEPDGASSSARAARNSEDVTPTPSVPLAATASVPVSQASAAAASASSSGEIEALRNQVAGLQAQLSAVRAAPPMCPAVALAASGAAAAAKTVGRTRPRLSPCQPSPDGTAERAVLSAYRINTIYTGQAWIESGQRTYVVEPGMSIDGMRIDRIDAPRRRVITSHGEIH
jgi:hypothetical protein